MCLLSHVGWVGMSRHARHMRVPSPSCQPSTPHPPCCQVLRKVLNCHSMSPLMGSEPATPWVSSRRSAAGKTAGPGQGSVRVSVCHTVRQAHFQAAGMQAACSTTLLLLRHCTQSRLTAVPRDIIISLILGALEVLLCSVQVLLLSCTHIWGQREVSVDGMLAAQPAAVLPRCTLHMCFAYACGTPTRRLGEPGGRKGDIVHPVGRHVHVGDGGDRVGVLALMLLQGAAARGRGM